jgi:hypothetical protein
MVSVHRFQGGVKDRLFQNNVNTHTGITLTISLAELKRDLSHDWVFPYQEVVEIHMSPAQWHQLLTEMNTLGVPCTLSHYFDKDGTFIRPVFPEDFDNELKRIEREFEEAIRRLETLSPEMAETLKGIYPKLSRKDAEALRGVVEGLHATLKSHTPSSGRRWRMPSRGPSNTGRLKWPLSWTPGFGRRASSTSRNWHHAFLPWPSGDLDKSPSPPPNRSNPW